MLTNFHTHTVFCDGKNTPEEMVLSAIEKGFTALGFSGHGLTSFDPGYCLRDTAGYRAEILRLKECYKDRITIYLGAEEDCLEPVDRSQYEYIIGSSHYVQVGEKIWSVDGKRETFQQLLALFDGEPALIVTRYDRIVQPDGAVMRLHQEDLCQALGVMPDGELSVTDDMHITSRSSRLAVSNPRHITRAASNIDGVSPAIVADDVSIRYDESSVDIEHEMVELAKNSVEYYTLVNKVNSEFSKLRTAINAE